MSKPPWAKYRLTNWTEYNAALKRRGSLMIWIDADLQWQAPSSGRTERPAVFSDAAIQFCLTLKCMFGLSNALAITCPAAPSLASAVPAFIAMVLGSPVLESKAADAPTDCADIRIECCHHGTRVTVNWPVAAAAECSRALKGLLQVLRQ